MFEDLEAAFEAGRVLAALDDSPGAIAKEARGVRRYPILMGSSPMMRAQVASTATGSAPMATKPHLGLCP